MIFLPDNATTRTPTIQEAFAYAESKLGLTDVVYAGSIAPGRDSFGEIIGTRDVLFYLTAPDFPAGNEPAEPPCRMTIWFEHAADGTPYLYGEY